MDEVVTAIIQGTSAEIVPRFPIGMEAIGTDTNGMSYFAVGV